MQMLKSIRSMSQNMSHTTQAKTSAKTVAWRLQHIQQQPALGGQSSCCSHTYPVLQPAGCMNVSNSSSSGQQQQALGTSVAQQIFAT